MTRSSDARLDPSPQRSFDYSLALELVRNGLSNSQIAKQLGVSISAVRSMISRLGYAHKIRPKPGLGYTLRVCGDVAEMDFGEGVVGLLDASDVGLLGDCRWRPKRGRKRDPLYVQRSNSIGEPRLHRLIMNPDKGVTVDHIDCNALDNRRSNLRLCSIGENSRNRRIGSNNTSGYKGVSLTSWGWQAQIKVNGRSIGLGCRRTAVEAALVYDRAARKYFGEFARPNFPDEQLSIPKTATRLSLASRAGRASPSPFMSSGV